MTFIDFGDNIIFNLRCSFSTLADETFSFERKKKLDSVNENVKAWEKLMWKFQKALPGADPDEKWVKMEKIYDLKGAINHIPKGL